MNNCGKQVDMEQMTQWETPWLQVMTQAGAKELWKDLCDEAVPGYSSTRWRLCCATIGAAWSVWLEGPAATIRRLLVATVGAA
jgi:hypothetical protein